MHRNKGAIYVKCKYIKKAFWKGGLINECTMKSKMRFNREFEFSIPGPTNSQAIFFQFFLFYHTLTKPGLENLSRNCRDIEI